MAQKFIFEGSTAIVLVKVLDQVRDEERAGIFKFRCLLTPMDKIDIDVLNRELIGPRPFEADKNAARLAWSLAQLRYRVSEAPDWWKRDVSDKSGVESTVWGSHCDENIIVEVLNMAVDAEETYLERLRREAANARDKLAQRYDDGDIAERLEVEDRREEASEESDQGAEPLGG